MSNTLVSEIEKILIENRMWLKSYARKVPLSEDLCVKTLRGFCAVGAAKLYSSLQEEGFNARLVMAENYNHAHFFVKLNNCVLDITATQFGHEEVICIPAKSVQKREWYWQAKFHIESPLEMHQMQLHEDWPEAQIIPLELAQSLTIVKKEKNPPRFVSA